MSHQSPNVDEKTMTDQLLEAYNLLSHLTNQNQEDTKNIPAPLPFQVDRLIEFLKLLPKKFSEATEPIFADDWLRSVTKDLVAIECTDAEKVRFTAQLLEGPAANWWYSYQITHPIENMTWELFQEGFRGAHIPSGVMQLKKEKFLNLRQGDQSVIEYMNEFNSLARYAPEEVDTDVKKKNRFINGLDDELSILMTIAYTPDYQTLVDQAIVLEGKMKQVAKRRQRHELDQQIHNVRATPTDMGNQEPKGSTWIKPSACKTCGEIGHTSNECHDEWPHMAAGHQIKGCFPSQVIKRVGNLKCDKLILCCDISS